MNDTDRLAEIRARADAAHPGPWTAGGDCIHPWEIVISGNRPFVELPDDQTADAEFIAAAREDVPWLLDQLEQARRELAATVKAKQENDERFMIQRDEARAERDEARDAVTLYRQYEEKYIAQFAKMAAESHEFGTEVTRLRDAIQRVRDLHKRTTVLTMDTDAHGNLIDSAPFCSDCYHGPGDDREWPCDTIRALDGEAT